eukprot:1601235-Pyramimonas_sp.AAC.1
MGEEEEETDVRLHNSLKVIDIQGKGKGYIAVAKLKAAELLLKEAPLQICGVSGSADDARRALAKLVVVDRRFDSLCAPHPVSEPSPLPGTSASVE